MFYKLAVVLCWLYPIFTAAAKHGLKVGRPKRLDLSVVNASHKIVHESKPGSDDMQEPGCKGHAHL